MGVVHFFRAVGVFEVDLVRVLLQIAGVGNQRILVELSLDDHGDGGAFEDAVSSGLRAFGLVDVLTKVDSGHVSALVGIGVRSVHIAIVSDGNGVVLVLDQSDGRTLSRSQLDRFDDGVGGHGQRLAGGVIDLEDTGLGCVFHRRIDVVAGVDRHGGGQLIVDIIANCVIRLSVRRVGAVALGINQLLVDGRGGVLQRHRAPAVGAIEGGRRDDRDGVGTLGVIRGRDILEEPQALFEFLVLTGLQCAVTGLIGSGSTGLGKFLGQRLGERTQRGAIAAPRAGQLAQRLARCILKYLLDQVPHRVGDGGVVAVVVGVFLVCSLLIASHRGDNGSGHMVIGIDEEAVDLASTILGDVGQRCQVPAIEAVIHLTSV